MDGLSSSIVGLIEIDRAASRNKTGQNEPTLQDLFDSWVRPAGSAGPASTASSSGPGRLERAATPNAIAVLEADLGQLQRELKEQYRLALSRL